MGAVMTASAGAIATMMLALWVASVRRRDASVVDAFWGPGFALVAWTSVAVAGAAPRALLLAALATAWGFRLGIHLALRARGKGEDRRYAAMRARHGERFPIASLFTVFLLQGALMWVVSLPLQAAAALSSAAPAVRGALGAWDIVGAAVFLAGFGIEAIADAQLSSFLSDPANGGRVMDRGLWRYSRHPNYFGDAVLWWGLGVVALSAGAWWALLGPAVMTLLLLKVSGVTLLEQTITERRPGYAEYVARTSAFVPWPPRGVLRS